MAEYQRVFQDQPGNARDYRIPVQLDGLSPFVFTVLSPTGEQRNWQRAGELLQIFSNAGPGDCRGRRQFLNFESYQLDWFSNEPYYLEHRPPDWVADHTIELWLPMTTPNAPSSSRVLDVPAAVFTGTWQTQSTSWVELGGGALRCVINGKAGDRLRITPPAVSFSVGAIFRLVRNSTEILLGNAVSGKEQTSWALNYSGGPNNGITYIGALPIGPPLRDVLPADGTYTYWINCRVNAGILYIGRPTYDAEFYGIRFPTVFEVQNLG